MPNQQYNLLGKKVSDTYHSLLQSGSDGKFYDGDGNEVIINATIPDIYVKYDQTGSFATTGSNIFRGDQIVTGSLFTSGSNTLIGSTTLTGSLNVTGSTTQIGNNNLLGNTTLSGSIIISGALGTNNPTVRIYGDTTHNGYIRFDPVTTNIDQNISASYIYVSGSTKDLYFTQNGNGYNNTTRLRWLEGNLYTGLLHGGRITSASSTTFNISSGSGIIVNLNASLTDDPYPTIKFVSWGNLTNQSLTYRTSSVQTFIGIDQNSAIIQQTTPWVNGEYNTSLQIGTVLHQNLSTINGSISYPNVAYGYKQRTYDFIKAFGPLKLSGYAINPSSSLGLTVGAGIAFAEGRNYQTDPNNPSYVTDPGTIVSKIFRYYQSGSSFVQDTNNGLGYTVIDPTRYNPNNSGSLQNVAGGQYTVQRVFWYPNSTTKGIVVYYGNTTYNSVDNARANYLFEDFNEVENTKQNAVYLGAIIIKSNGSFTTAADYQIITSGLFRSSVGGGGGGGGGTTSPGGNSGQIQYNNGGTFGGVPNLTWDGSTLTASGSFTGDLIGTSSWATNALTASFAPSYLPIASTSSMLSPYVLNSQTSSFVLNSQTGSFTRLAIGSVTASVTPTQFQVTSESSTELLVTGTGVTIGNVITDTHRITGSLNISGSITATSFTGAQNGFIYFMTTNPASLTVSGGVEQNLASITIPANTVQIGDRLEIFYSFNKVGTAGTSAYRVRISGSGIDGTLLNNGAAQGATVLGLTTQNLYRVLSTSSMVGSSQFFGGAATVGIGVNYTGSSLTGNNTFYFNAIRNNAADTITLNDCYIKIIR